MKIKIFVCCHKKDFYIHSEIFQPIHVGKAISNEILQIPGDDTGNNISNKNPWYCELTAQYWIWKNVKDVDYVGLFHYRRYLCFKPSIREKLIRFIHKTEKLMYNYKIDESLIMQNEVILPNKLSANLPLYYDLCMTHIQNDVNILRDIIYELYPEYISAYDFIMFKNNELSPFNILIAKKNIFDMYSEWLFSILFEFEKKITVPANPYQPRLFGYYSERLLNVYFYHNKYKVSFLPTCIVDSNKDTNVIIQIFSRYIRKICSIIYNKTRIRK